MLSPAVILDRDDAFEAEVRQALASWDIGAIRSDRDDFLDTLQRIRPSIIFVEVEDPDQLGFALCSQIRTVTKSTPIVLSSRTLTRERLELHQKLKIHADAYLLKHRLHPVRLREVIGRLLGCVASPDPSSSFGQTTGDAVVAPRAVPPWSKASSPQVDAMSAQLEQAEAIIEKHRRSRARALFKARAERRERRKRAAEHNRIEGQIAKEVAHVYRSLKELRDDLDRERAQNIEAQRRAQQFQTEVTELRRALSNAARVSTDHDLFKRWLANERHTHRVIRDILERQQAWMRDISAELGEIEHALRGERPESEHAVRARAAELLAQLRGDAGDEASAPSTGPSRTTEGPRHVRGDPEDAAPLELSPAAGRQAQLEQIARELAAHRGWSTPDSSRSNRSNGSVDGDLPELLALGEDDDYEQF
ncbi:MAG: response regulator [Myxococcota bacterium]